MGPFALAAQSSRRWGTTLSSSGQAPAPAANSLGRRQLVARVSV